MNKSDNTPLLELIQVSKSYEPSPGGEGDPVLKDITLRVEAGESLAVVGPSGSGKSTLLNIIGALDLPTSGRVCLDGKDLAEQGEIELARIRNLEIGFVFQLHHLLAQLTVLENVLVPTMMEKDVQARKNLEDRARKLLERVGLAKRMSYTPGRLSGGERQRVAVVRALINSPRLLLADEPTGSLDRSASGELGELLVELNREEGVTLIVVTHAPDLADRMARTLELENGELVPWKGLA